MTSAVTPVVTGVGPSSGTHTGGTTVLISGSRLGLATSVTFGAADAPGFTIVSDTQIYVSSPAHAAGVVDVTVTNGYGTSATSAVDQFTYT